MAKYRGPSRSHLEPKFKRWSNESNHYLYRGIDNNNNGNNIGNNIGNDIGNNIGNDIGNDNDIMVMGYHTRTSQDKDGTKNSDGGVAMMPLTTMATTVLQRRNKKRKKPLRKVLLTAKFVCVCV